MDAQTEPQVQEDQDFRAVSWIAPPVCDDMLNEFKVDEIETPKSPFVPFSSMDSSQLGLLATSDDFVCTEPPPLFENEPTTLSMPYAFQTGPPCKLEDVVLEYNDPLPDVGSSEGTESPPKMERLAGYIKAPVEYDEVGKQQPEKKRVQKPPTTAGITLDNLKAVFSLERPEAEKRLGLKRTTFSNLSRYYGISKWPFRTIRDAKNRKKANERLLHNKVLSKEKRRKLLRQQITLQGVINLMYTDPTQSKDSNTLAVLMSKVASREGRSMSPPLDII